MLLAGHLVTKVLQTLRCRALLSMKNLAEHLQLCIVDDFWLPVSQNRFLQLLLKIRTYKLLGSEGRWSFFSAIAFVLFKPSGLRFTVI